MTRPRVRRPKDELSNWFPQNPRRQLSEFCAALSLQEIFSGKNATHLRYAFTLRIYATKQIQIETYTKHFSQQIGRFIFADECAIQVIE